MKHLIRIVLLIFLPVLGGCSQQNPAGAPAPAARIPEGLDERHAANYLAMAKDLQKDGESKQAILLLNELLATFPESDAATDARQILADLQEQSHDAKAALGNHHSGELVTVQGLLTHFPQDVKSVEAWLGHEFMVNETPIRTTEEVTRDVLMTMVGEAVEIEGPWNAGQKLKPAQPEGERSQLQAPSYSERVTVVTGSGIEASSAKRIEK